MPDPDPTTTPAVLIPPDTPVALTVRTRAEAVVGIWGRVSAFTCDERSDDQRLHTMQITEAIVHDHRLRAALAQISGWHRNAEGDRRDALRDVLNLLSPHSNDY